MRVLIRFLRGTPWLVAAAVAGTIAVATMAAADVYTRADSTSMRLKIERIVQAERAVAQRQAPAGLTTPLTQREVNSYLRYDLALAGAGRDRRAGHHHRRRGPAARRGGGRSRRGQPRQPAEGVLRSDAAAHRPPAGARPGRARDQPRHRPLLARVGEPSPACRCPSRCCRRSSATTRAARRTRDGIGLDDPFALPAAIREIRVEPGRAIVVQ